MVTTRFIEGDAGAGRGPGGKGATNRQKVLGHIRAHPGVHLRKVCRDLGLGIGDVQYHVDRLEKEGTVTSSRRGLYRRFYPGGLFGEREGVILSALAQRTPREVILHLIEEPGSSQEHLAGALAISPPSVSWNLKRLVQLGLVERQQSGRFSSYRVAGDGSEIASFIRSFHPGVWERWSSRLADAVMALSGEGNDGGR
ncbi:MAG: winged helix-turn-helix transcriptional regulator [Nitrososphaerota archaeon]|nr:winged helix-turn-helix transcriptional regulator [Nitrososphaerota archaeon]